MHPGERPLLFDETTIDSAAQALRALNDLIDQHGTGQPEHTLEARVLRHSITVEPDGEPLDVWLEDALVSRGSQFPTLWTETGSTRYLDALLRCGSVPWAVELKVRKSGGSGSYYRHGLAQAVLYRHFIRSAKPLHPWFKEKGVEPRSCEAALGFPHLPHAPVAYQERIAVLRRLGEIFDVKVVELATDIE